MDPERIENIYNELSTLVIELDINPAARGPLYLQELISRARGFLNRTSLLTQEVHREKHLLERDLDAHKTAFSASSDELLAEDVRVTRLPNIDDRKAMINILLKDDRAKIADLERQIKELGFVEKAVRNRHKELDNTVSSIRMQKSLIEVELRTGAYYGDENDTSRGGVYRKTQDPGISDDELATLLADPDELDTVESDEIPVSNSAPLQLGVVVETEPKTAGKPSKIEESEEASINNFLEEDDYSDIFDNL